MGPKLIRHGAIEPILTHRSTGPPRPTFSSRLTRGFLATQLRARIDGAYFTLIHPLYLNVVSPMVGPVGSTLPRFVQNVYAGTELTKAPLGVLISL